MPSGPNLKLDSHYCKGAGNIQSKNIVENKLEVISIYLYIKIPSVDFKKKLEGSIDLTATGLRRQLGVETAKSLLVRDKIHRI